MLLDFFYVVAALLMFVVSVAGFAAIASIVLVPVFLAVIELVTEMVDFLSKKLGGR